MNKEGKTASIRERIQALGENINVKKVAFVAISAGIGAGVLLEIIKNQAAAQIKIANIYLPLITK